MYETESFIFLDVQKTGSSFIISTLKKFGTELLIRREKHVGLGADYNKVKFCFISVRDPLDQYLSLYSYGCEKKGDFFLRMKRMGKAGLYDGTLKGLRKWLSYVLEPDNASLLGEGFGSNEVSNLGRLIGFQSFRVLILAIPNANVVLSTASCKQDVRDIYRNNNISTFTIKYETLRLDFERLLSTKLRHSIKNLDKALQYVRSEEPRNASVRVDRKLQGPFLDNDMRELVYDREWFIRETFDY